MKSFGSLLTMGVVALSLSWCLTGCGGGSPSTSREGGSDASLTASSAGQVSDTVTQAVKLVAPTAAMGELKISGISSEQSPPLVSILEHVLSASENSIVAKHTSALYDKQCAGGGNITATVSSIDPVKQLIKGEVTANKCKVGTQILNGTMKVEYKPKNPSDLLNPTYENLKNFEKVTITTSGFTYENANSDNITLNEIVMVLKDFTYNGNSLTGGSITIGGIIYGTISGEAINVECDSFGLQFTSSPSGVTVSASGRIKATCLNGWVTMATNTPVFLAANTHCPTSGNISVMAGGNTVVVNIASDTKITFYFNNNLVRTFNTCNEVIGLCTG